MASNDNPKQISKTQLKVSYGSSLKQLANTRASVMKQVPKVSQFIVLANILYRYLSMLTDYAFLGGHKNFPSIDNCQCQTTDTVP